MAGTNPFDQFDPQEEEQAAANPFDQFDTAEPETEEPEQEGITLTPRQIELQDYAQQLQEQSGGYENADLEAAGFSAEDISAYSSFVQQEQDKSSVPFEPTGTLTNGGYPTDMWDSFESFEAAINFYQDTVLADPNVTPPPLGVGYAIYTNPETGETDYITPPSPRVLGSGAKSDSFDLAAVGFANALGNVIELGGAGLEYLGVEGATEAAGDILPGVNTGTSTADALIVEGLPMLVAGGGTGNAVYQGLKATPQILRAAASLIAGEVANASVSETDGATIAIGDNAMFPMLRGIDLGDTEAENVIEARMNILIDGLMAGGVVSGTVSGVLTLGKFANNLMLAPILDATYRAESAAERKMYESIVDAIVGVDKAVLDDPNRLFEARDKIAQIIQQNKDITITRLTELDKTDPLILDTMSALERGIQGEDADAIISVIQGLRNAQLQSNATLTSSAVRGPMSALDKQTGELLTETGGKTVAEQTGIMAQSADELAQQGRDVVVAAGQSAEEAAALYNRSANELVADIANDLELSDEITRLANAVGTEIDTTRVGSRNQIVNQIEAGYETLTEQKNTLYGAIQGGEIDVQGLINVLDDLPTEQITQAANTTKNSSPVRGLLDVTRRRNISETNWAGEPVTRAETDEERVARIATYLENNGIDFGFFYREVRPELSQLAQDAFGSGTAAGASAGRNFRDLVSYIDKDMLDNVIKTGDDELAEAATTAMEFYQNTYAPLFREGKLADYADLYESTIGRTAKGAPRRIGEVDYQTGTRSLMENTMTEGSPAQIDQFKQLLSMPEAGGNPAPLAEYMVADTISQAYDSLRASGGTDAQLGGYISTLRQYSEALNEVFPDRAAELNTFIRSIEEAQGNRGLLEQRMKDAQVNVQETLERVQNGELRFFFRQEFGEVDNPLLRELATTSNPQQSFREIILSNGTDRLAAMEAIMQRINTINDPDRQKIVRDGVQTAYLRLFRDQVLSPRTEIGGARAVLPTRIDRSADELNALFQMGDVIYRDMPEVMTAVREVSDLAAGLAKSRNAVPVSSMSATEFNRQATTATTRLIYLTVGPLDKAGSRIRAVLGTAIESADGYSKAAGIRDKILADPNEFLRLSRLYNRQPNDEALQAMLLRFMFEGGVRSTDPATNSDEDVEMQMIFPQ